MRCMAWRYRHSTLVQNLDSRQDSSRAVDYYLNCMILHSGHQTAAYLILKHLKPVVPEVTLATHKNTHTIIR